jgi:hypothetical protein
MFFGTFLCFVFSERKGGRKVLKDGAGEYPRSATAIMTKLFQNIVTFLKAWH